MKMLPKSKKEFKQDMNVSLTRGHIDFILSVAGERKITFSQALNWIVDQQMNRELYQLLERSA
ncbi:hypothetical protein [Pseudomonas oryzihabitans]|uniref:hypothetical protein n=1 Tax=Pseudomonas oryzihabitans TaxID=47885 RepID=UPI00119FBEAC|nr:hypothetical protein [Pseudomonas oryzihabitans]